MSFENLEGTQESSHHSGEVYRRRVRDYLEAGEYLEVGDSHTGTSDITLTRPAHREDKHFRVETKNTKVSLLNDDFIDELARQFVDFSRADGMDFEFMVFATDFAKQSRWKDIFHDRVRKEDEVRSYYDEITERHSLNDAEAEQFERLGFRDFWQFLEQVQVKKAGYERLGELIDERESEERWKAKWEFYMRENAAIREPGELIPNFVRIADYPDSIWILQSVVHDYHAVYDQNPRYLPIWFDSGQAYSLLPPDEMPDSLRKFVDTDTADQHDFGTWLNQEGDQHQRTVTALLNRQTAWRGIQRNERCVGVRHDGVTKLIMSKSTPEPDESPETKQQDLFGNIQEAEENSDSNRNQTVDGYVAVKDWGSAFAHRYGLPIVKRYDDYHYVFVRTGWLFTERGRGDSVITGERADALHRELNKNQQSRNTNQRGQFRQWYSYLDLNEEGNANTQLSGTARTGPSQEMLFEQPTEMELHERPPKNASEREYLMSEGDIQ